MSDLLKPIISAGGLETIVELRVWAWKWFQLRPGTPFTHIKVNCPDHIVQITTLERDTFTLHKPPDICIQQLRDWAVSRGRLGNAVIALLVIDKQPGGFANITSTCYALEP